MSLYNTKPQDLEKKERPCELLDKAILCLRQGQNAQGFLLLSSIAEKEKDNPAAAFALALCYIRSEETSKAIPHLEQALRLTRSLSLTQPNTAENTDTYIRLYQAQLNNQFYLDPIDTDFCTLFPKEAERTILLALIHAYRKMSMEEKVRQLSAGLSGKIFEEYKKRLDGENR